MPCTAPSRNNLGVQGPCGFPNVAVVAGADVSAENLCYPHYAMKWGHSGIPKGLVGGIDQFTVLMLHGDSLRDEMGHPLTANGGAGASNAASKFGGSSLFFDGADDTFSIPDSPDWAFGSGPFTVDFWAYFNSVALPRTFLAQYSAVAGNWSWNFTYLPGSGLRFDFSDAGTALSISAIQPWTPNPTQWYHIAFVRSGNSCYLFVDGVLLGAPSTYNLSAFDSNEPLLIGGRTNNVNWMNGYMDEIRISKGIARWTSNFAVPTAPYT